MPKLIENVLIGDQVRLVGEDISEADAKGVRPEVFAGAEDPSESEKGDGGEQADDPEKPTGGRGKRTSTK